MAAAAEPLPRGRAGRRRQPRRPPHRGSRRGQGQRRNAVRRRPRSRCRARSRCSPRRRSRRRRAPARRRCGRRASRWATGPCGLRRRVRGAAISRRGPRAGAASSLRMRPAPSRRSSRSSTRASRRARCSGPSSSSRSSPTTLQGRRALRARVQALAQARAHSWPGCPRVRVRVRVRARACWQPVVNRAQCDARPGHVFSRA